MILMSLGIPGVALRHVRSTYERGEWLNLLRRYGGPHLYRGHRLRRPELRGKGRALLQQRPGKVGEGRDENENTVCDLSCRTLSPSFASLARALLTLVSFFLSFLALFFCVCSSPHALACPVRFAPPFVLLRFALRQPPVLNLPTADRYDARVGEEVVIVSRATDNNPDADVDIFVSHTICPMKDGECVKATDSDATAIGGGVAFGDDEETTNRNVAQRTFRWTPQAAQMTAYTTSFAVYFEARTTNFQEPGHQKLVYIVVSDPNQGPQDIWMVNSDGTRTKTVSVNEVS